MASSRRRRPLRVFARFPPISPCSLDKAFHRGEIIIRHARAVSTQLARRASDHLPLLIDFHLPNGSPARDP
jgi:endonuclease/exonuclease/phosphatase family metal-dependent hydrolase